MSDLLTLTANVDLQAAAKDKPVTVTILAYTGAEVRPIGMGPTVIDVSGLTLGKVPLLVDHDTRLAGVVGAGVATVDKSNVLVTGRLTRASVAATTLIAMAADGVDWQASVGMNITKSEHVRPGDSVEVNGRTFKAGPRGLTVARKGELKEVSIVTLGADGDTAVSIAAKRGNKMTDTNTTTPDADVHERDRLEAIHEVRNKFASHFQGRENERDDMIAAAIDDTNMTATKLELELYKSSMTVSASAVPRPDYLQSVRDSRPKLGAKYSGGRRGGQTDVLEASLMLRAGNEKLAVDQYGENVVYAAHESRIDSLEGLCRASLQMQYLDVPRGRDEMLRAAFSTTSLPNVLSNVMGRTLEMAYEEAISDIRKFATVKSAANFKPQKSIRPSSVENAEITGPTGELKHGTVREEDSYNWQIATYGKMLGITRTDIINDDLSLFDDVPMMLAQAASRALLDLFYTAIIDGQTNSFFSSGNGNLLTTSSVLGTTSLELGVKTIKQQVDSKGNNISIRPRVLLVSPTEEFTARTLLNSAEIRDTSANTTFVTGNPTQGIVDSLVVEARLANSDKFANANSANWFLFGGPMSSAIILGFLDGRQAPVVETSDAPFNTLGTHFRVYHDFGVALGDAKAALKATGAS